MLKIFCIVLLTAIASAVARYISKRSLLLVQRTNNVWDNILYHSLSAPLQALVWLVGLSIAAGINAEADDYSEWIKMARSVGVILTIAWFALRFVKQTELTLQDPQKVTKPLDPTTASALSKLLRLTTMITSGLIILQTLGFSVSGVLAFGGIGGIAVGFAAKDLLANFFGGLMIYLDRPFTVGDWIRSPDRNIEGTVEDIGWRLTCIRTFDKRPLYVPNATFANIAVENPSRMTYRRIHESFGLRYDDLTSAKGIVSEIYEWLNQYEAINNQQTLMVNINEFSDSSIDFFIYCFTHTTDWVTYHNIKQTVLLKVADIILAAGADIAYPTRTLHVSELIHSGVSDKASPP
ncbi:mechanosensitive ion channel family protein [bacterium]|nr:mechanosensitive ion channel family protein [bacterium]